MSFTVYGIRLIGEREVRYIGQTSQTLKARFSGICTEHGRDWSGWPRYTAFGQWLDENRELTEIFAIAKCDTRDEALATERVMIALCLRLNQRLFNGDHVPKHLRLVSAA